VPQGQGRDATAAADRADPASPRIQIRPIPRDRRTPDKSFFLRWHGGQAPEAITLRTIPGAAGAATPAYATNALLQRPPCAGAGSQDRPPARGVKAPAHQRIKRAAGVGPRKGGTSDQRGLPPQPTTILAGRGFEQTPYPSFFIEPDRRVAASCKAAFIPRRSKLHVRAEIRRGARPRIRAASQAHKRLTEKVPAARAGRGGGQVRATTARR
jgi:hypothetical protein